MKIKLNLGNIEAEGMKVEGISIETAMTLGEVRGLGDEVFRLTKRLPEVIETIKGIIDNIDCSPKEEEEDKYKKKENKHANVKNEPVDINIEAEGVTIKKTPLGRVIDKIGDLNI